MKRRHAHLAPTIFVGALVAACVNVKATPIGKVGPAVPPDSVQVFATKAPADYQEIAVLKTDRILASDRKTLAALRKQAAKLGADGLLLINVANSGTKQHDGVGVILVNGDPKIVAGSGETRVDAFERAVAIRVVKQ